jgi:hypothetical protein
MIGSDVRCGDGVCGGLSQMVVDPASGVLTHVIVAPHSGHGVPRIVPVELVGSAGDEVELRCTLLAFNALEPAEWTDAPLDPRGWPGYERAEIPGWSYFGMMMGEVTVGVPIVTYKRVPEGEVVVRRGEHAYASNGAIGRVQGLVVRSGDHRVTGVLLDEGRLWSKRRVAIPIRAIRDFSDGVRLRLTKDQVRGLPAVSI